MACASSRERGQVEFVGSAKYHAILPLINEHEQRRQIRRNHLTNRHFFGDAEALTSSMICSGVMANALLAA